MMSRTTCAAGGHLRARQQGRLADAGELVAPEPLSGRRVLACGPFHVVAERTRPAEGGMLAASICVVVEAELREQHRVAPPIDHEMVDRPDEIALVWRQARQGTSHERCSA